MCLWNTQNCVFCELHLTKHDKNNVEKRRRVPGKSSLLETESEGCIISFLLVWWPSGRWCCRCARCANSTLWMTNCHPERTPHLPLMDSFPSHPQKPHGPSSHSDWCCVVPRSPWHLLKCSWGASVYHQAWPRQTFVPRYWAHHLLHQCYGGRTADTDCHHCIVPMSCMYDGFCLV